MYNHCLRAHKGHVFIQTPLEQSKTESKTLSKLKTFSRNSDSKRNSKRKPKRIQNVYCDLPYSFLPRQLALTVSIFTLLTYHCNNVLGQNTENYYIFYKIHHWHTFGSHLTRSSTTARHHDSRSNMLLTSFPGPIPSCAFAHPSLSCPPFSPKARAFTKHKGELLKCSD